MKQPTTVLVVDDSAMMRKLITDILRMSPGIEVVGEAHDGIDALKKIAQLHPDVVTMDVEMPRLNGLQTLHSIMRHHPRPVVMLSAITSAGAAATLACLEAGAVDFVAKPGGAISNSLAALASELVAKIRLAANLSVGPRSAPPRSQSAEGTLRESKGSQVDLVVIGCSTGGPSALHEIIPRLPSLMEAAIVVVQHMPPKFTASLADRLNQVSEITVREASHGETARPGLVLIAPGGAHLKMGNGMEVRLDDGPSVNGVKPSIDVTLQSVAPLYGSRTMAVLLTGMGADGARGLKAIRDCGGRTIAQDEASCVVYGMPRAAVALGAVEETVDLDKIARVIAEQSRRPVRGAIR